MTDEELDWAEEEGYQRGYGDGLAFGLDEIDRLKAEIEDLKVAVADASARVAGLRETLANWGDA